MQNKVRYSKQEKEEDYRDVEAMLRAGYSYTQMQQELGKCPQYYCRIKKDLVKIGKITQEEIDRARLNNQQDKEQNKDDKSKSERRKAQFQERNEIIQALIEFNIPYDIISAVFNLSFHTISNIRKDKRCLTIEERELRNEKILALIEFKVPYKIISAIFNLKIKTIKKIKQEVNCPKREINKVVKPIKDIDDSLTISEVKILKYLMQGYNYTYISKKMQMQRDDLRKLVKSLKKRSYISQEMINEALNTRREYYKKIVIELYQKGLRYMEMLKAINQDDIPEISITYLRLLIEELQEEGLIEKRTLNHYAKIDEQVLKFLKEGLTVKEIYGGDTTQTLTESRVRQSKKRLVEEGKITEQEIKKLQNKRARKKKREECQKLDEQIWYYIENYGMSNEEIEKYIGFDVTTVYRRLREIAKRKKICNKDIKRIRKQAREAATLKKFMRYNEYLLYLEFLEKKKEFIKAYNDEVPSDEINIVYFDSFKKLINIPSIFQKEDIDILNYVVLYTKSLCNNDNISLVITSYLAIQDKNSANHALNDYVSWKNSNKEVIDFQKEMLDVIDKFQVKKKLRTLS